jgi:CheY-like chemotaxis protein
MDIMMPNMSGETCLKKLKDLPNFNTPVIALTADAVAGAKDRYLANGLLIILLNHLKRTNKN